jgi:hypothetical protein
MRRSDNEDNKDDYKDNEDDYNNNNNNNEDNKDNNNNNNEDDYNNNNEDNEGDEEEDDYNDYNYYNERSDREQGYDTEMKEVYRIAAEERDRFCLLNDVDDKRVFCVDGSNITIDMCRALKAQLHDAFKLHGLAYELMSTTKPSLVVAYIKSGFTGYEPSLEFIKKIK